MDCKKEDSRTRSKSQRITVRFKEDEIAIIDNLVESIGAKDRSELIRSAVMQLNDKYKISNINSHEDISLNRKLEKKYMQKDTTVKNKALEDYTKQELEISIQLSNKVINDLDIEENSMIYQMHLRKIKRLEELNKLENN